MKQVGKTADGVPSYRDAMLTTWRFTPVYSMDPDSENKKFWDATPSGSLELGSTSLPDGHFVIGKSYYLDITEAPE